MVVSNHGAGDDGFIPFVLQIHLRYRDIEFAMQTRDERLDPPALFFEGGASGEVQMDGEDGEQGYSIGGGGGGRIASRSGIKAGAWTVVISHMRSCFMSSYS